MISEALFLITNRAIIVELLGYECLNEKENYSNLRFCSSSLGVGIP